MSKLINEEKKNSQKLINVDSIMKEKESQEKQDQRLSAIRDDQERLSEKMDVDERMSEKKAELEEKLPDTYEIGKDLIKKKPGVIESGEDSKEFQKIKNGVLMLNSFLENNMPPFTSDEASEAKFRDEIDGAVLAATLFYNKIVAAADEYLEKKDQLGDATMDRIRLIKELKEKCRKENEEFAGAVKIYRQEMSFDEGNHGKSGTWLDVLRYERSDKIDLDAMSENDYEEVGKGLSHVLKIKEGGKTRYYKSDDTVSEDPVEEIAEKISKKVGMGEDFTAKVKEAIENDTVNTSSKQVYLNVAKLHYGIRDGKTADFKKESEYEFERLICANLKNKKLGLFMGEFWKAFNLQRMSDNSGIDRGKTMAKRNVAASRLARVLKMGYIVTDANSAHLKKGKQTENGIIMEEAKGYESGEVVKKTKAKRAKYDTEAIKQLICLQVFDVLCGQVDRHYGNYLVDGKKIKDDYTISSIRAIDNDMAFGKLSFENVKKGFNARRLRPVTRELISALPRNVKDSILALDDVFVSFLLNDILDREEIEMLNDRIKGVQGVIKKVDEANNKLKGKEGYAYNNDDDIAALKYASDIVSKASFSEDGTEMVIKSTVFYPAHLYRTDQFNEEILKRKREIDKKNKEEAKKKKKKKQHGAKNPG